MGKELMVRRPGGITEEYLNRKELIWSARIQQIITIPPGTAGPDTQPALPGTERLLNQPAARRLQHSLSVTAALYVFQFIF